MALTLPINRHTFPRRLIIIAMLTMIVSCTRDSQQTLVTIADAREEGARLTDLGAPGDSTGDILTFDQPLLNAQGERIGRNSGVCIRTQVGHSFQCQWTLSLEHGSIQVTGREFDEGTSLIAIIGGTGMYTGITGQMESENNGDGTFTQTLRYRLGQR